MLILQTHVLRNYHPIPSQPILRLCLHHHPFCFLFFCSFSTASAILYCSLLATVFIYSLFSTQMYTFFTIYAFSFFFIFSHSPVSQLIYQTQNNSVTIQSQHNHWGAIQEFHDCQVNSQLSCRIVYNFYKDKQILISLRTFCVWDVMWNNIVGVQKSRKDKEMNLKV